MSGEFKLKNKLNNKFLFIALFVIIGVTLVALATILPAQAKNKKIVEQLSLGEKYMSALEYEQAEVVYLAIIEIDPKNMEAYRSLVDIYFATDETEKAEELLEKASEYLSEEDLEELEFYYNTMIKADNSSASTQDDISDGINISEAGENTQVQPDEQENNEEQLLSEQAKKLYYYTIADNKVTINGMKSLVNYWKENGHTKFKLPETIEGYPVTALDRHAFSGRSIEGMELPESLESIGFAVFNNCENLDYITIPSGVITIGESAFSGCIYLSYVIIEEGVTNIESNAFSYCNSLKHIVIPESVSYIADDTFGSSIYDYQHITIHTPSGSYAEQWAKEKGISVDNTIASEYVYSREYRELYDLSVDHLTNEGVFRGVNDNDITECTIPKNWNDYLITSLKQYAFQSCMYLKKVMIPEGIKSIEEAVFRNCFSLTEVNFPSSLEVIGQDAFKYCCSLENITLPDGLITIKESAFADTAITHVSVPNSVTNLGNWAFADCKALKSAVLPENLTTIPYCIFNGCSSLTDVAIPEGVTIIDEGAFRDCTSLQTIHIPESVTEIRWYAFFGCTSLKEIYIPASVTFIDQAFPYETVIHTSAGSYAEQWALENNREVVIE